MQCARHPETETYVTCVRCGTPVCYRCQVQSEVGLLCPTHGRRTPSPLYQVPLILYVRAAGAALALALFAAGALRLLALLAPFLVASLLVPLVLGAGLGYLVAEGVGWAAGRRRGRWLQAIAALAVVAALVGGLGDLALVSLGGVIGVVVGVVVAVGRLG